MASFKFVSPCTMGRFRIVLPFLILALEFLSVSAQNSTDEEEEPAICRGGKGQFLPLGGQAELNWDDRLRGMLYFVGLLYSFVGVSIVADIFMAAIERITSKKKRVWLPGPDKMVTKNVWNETVANLTLMALGSSAPEILLALNDVVKRHFKAGQMGPSTIVGSAAFNLFVIIAVCINAIPNGETRQIKETQVFAITAVWSIFAYVWLLFIVQFWTPSVITVLEGSLTVSFFPMLVIMSWAADVGMLTRENMGHVFSSLCAGGGTSDEADGDADVGVGRILLKMCAGLCRRTCLKIVGCVKSCVCCCCCCCRHRRQAREHHPVLGEEGDALEEGLEAIEEDEIAEILDEEGEPIDCEEGVFTFKHEMMDVWVGREEKVLTIPVLRKNGSEGRVSVQYRMEGLTAVPGYDFDDQEGSLEFKSGVTHADIEVTILPKVVGEKDDVFQIILEEPDGGACLHPLTDGGEDACVLTITLHNANPQATNLRGKLYAVLDGMVNVDEIWLGTSCWKDQILENIYVNGSPEGQAEAGWLDWIMHVLFIPWKVIYAITCPPPTYFGGMVCFFVALAQIGLLTSIIGDLAELFGCAAGIDDTITAITFVALGTSLPDTFASKTAAMQDEWADASIVNVTGSNSVNVFLGIGLPWCMAAVYWSYVGVNDDWLKRYGPNGKVKDYTGMYPEGGFIVEGSENLAFSVIVFTLFAFVCLIVINIRRKIYGGELGGPPDMKATSSFLLVMLWISYVGLQVWKSGEKTNRMLPQVIAVLVVIPVLVILMVVFLILMQVLKVSKKYIGEEGFWGIFVAVCLIGLRMVVFQMFQNTA